MGTVSVLANFGGYTWYLSIIRQYSFICIRPAFLEEFTALEKELEELFVQFSLRLRCLNLLEKQFNDSEIVQMEKQIEIGVPQITTIPLEKMDESDIFLEKGDNMNIDRSGAVNRHERQKAATASKLTSFLNFIYQ